MDRRQAAEFLGVSLRTLDRLVSKGRLSKGKALLKTRPIVVFRQEELTALKEELGKQKASASQFCGVFPPKETVAFRIDPHYLGRLTSQAKPLGLSPGEYARQLVIQALEKEPSEKFSHEVRRLREALAAVFYALLTTRLGSSPTEARRLVDEAILKE